MFLLIEIFIIFALSICAEIGNKNIIINALLSTDGTSRTAEHFYFNKMKEIKLTQGKVALVDDEDFEYLNKWKWHAKKDKHTFYAQRTIWDKNHSKSIKMHRVILNLNDADGFCADHIDRNGLNNQKINLRKCSFIENMCNRVKQKNSKSTSKYKGVSLFVSRNYSKKKLMYIYGEPKFIARIGIGNSVFRIGTFETEEAAAIAYNEAAKKYHGEFAALNIVKDETN